MRAFLNFRIRRLYRAAHTESQSPENYFTLNWNLFWKNYTVLNRLKQTWYWWWCHVTKSDQWHSGSLISGSRFRHLFTVSRIFSLAESVSILDWERDSWISAASFNSTIWCAALNNGAWDPETIQGSRLQAFIASVDAIFACFSIVEISKGVSRFSIYFLIAR